MIESLPYECYQNKGLWYTEAKKISANFLLQRFIWFYQLLMKHSVIWFLPLCYFLVFRSMISIDTSREKCLHLSIFCGWTTLQSVLSRLTYTSVNFLVHLSRFLHIIFHLTGFPLLLLYFDIPVYFDIF